MYYAIPCTSIDVRLMRELAWKVWVASHGGHLQSLLSPVGHRAAMSMSLFHRVLSFAIACASPHDEKYIYMTNKLLENSPKQHAWIIIYFLLQVDKALPR